MRSSFLFVRQLLVLASISLISLASALTYPVGAPAGETTGGTYRTYFDNMFPGCSIVGDVIASFTST